MIVAILAFLGGVLTIVSPCILPVLPFVFARTHRPFTRSTLPLLFGMAATFALVATLAAFGGGWAVSFNNYGRTVALILLAITGLTLLFERFATLLTRPIVSLGNRLLASSAITKGNEPLKALVLGVAIGFLWAPCAGPILGLILTGAAIRGPSFQTTVLLFAYALGAVTSLALATFAGAKVLIAMKRSLGVGEWLRRGAGIAIIAGVVVIALGWDTGFLTRLSLARTSQLEESLLEAINPESTSHVDVTTKPPDPNMSNATTPPVEGQLPRLDGAVAWLNSPPLTPEALRGKVVLVDFWTYSCINCLRALPYLKGWYERYKDSGLVVLGVHAPEFAFEKDESNVKKAVRDLGITYPIVLDNNYEIWQAFNNRYWPAHYFIDRTGRIRGSHFGEGDYYESEKLLRQLLAEGGVHDLPAPLSAVNDEGVQAAPDDQNVESPETYVGYQRASEFASPGDFAREKPKLYEVPASLQLDQWALGGTWRVEAEKAVSLTSNGTIVFRFHARDLHLVLGPGSEGRPIHFRVTIDGQAPGENHGIDTDANGIGIVRDQRLYQLIRQSGPIRDRTFAIEFLDGGLQAYSFTFG